MLEVIAQPDNTFALSRRHHSLDGRIVDAIVSTHPTKNAAHDALYDELHAILIPRSSTAKLKARDHVTVSIIAVTVLSIGIGALGLWCGSPVYDADPGMAIAAALHPAAAPASYSTTIDR